MSELKLMSYQDQSHQDIHSSAAHFGFTVICCFIHNRNTINLQCSRDRQCMYKLWECVFLSQTTGRVNKSNSTDKNLHHMLIAHHSIFFINHMLDNCHMTNSPFFWLATPQQGGSCALKINHFLPEAGYELSTQ